MSTIPVHTLGRWRRPLLSCSNKLRLSLLTPPVSCLITAPVIISDLDVASTLNLELLEDNNQTAVETSY